MKNLRLPNKNSMDLSNFLTTHLALTTERKKKTLLKPKLLSILSPMVRPLVVNMHKTLIVDKINIIKITNGHQPPFFCFSFFLEFLIDVFHILHNILWPQRGQDGAHITRDYALYTIARYFRLLFVNTHSHRSTASNDSPIQPSGWYHLCSLFG